MPSQPRCGGREPSSSVRFAQERGEGRDVALVCSGDPGIYAMASLVCEMLDPASDESLTEPQRRIAGAFFSPGTPVDCDTNCHPGSCERSKQLSGNQRKDCRRHLMSPCDPSAGSRVSLAYARFARDDRACEASVTARARYPSRDSRASFRADNLAGTTAHCDAARTRSACRAFVPATS